MGNGFLHSMALAHLISFNSHEAAQIQKPHRYSLVFILKGITERLVITSFSQVPLPTGNLFKKPFLFEHPKGTRASHAKLCLSEGPAVSRSSDWT